MAIFAEAYSLKVDTFTKLADEQQMIAGKAEDIFQFMHSRRKERDGNNFPIFLKYGIKSLDRSATRRSAAWTPMHRESNG